MQSRILAIAFIVLALALLVAGVWWDNQRTSAVTERLRATAVTSTSIAPPAAEAPAAPPVADAPISHLEVTQAPLASVG